VPTEEEINNALLAIYSRLGTIEGRVTLIARAGRNELLDALREIVGKQPLVGQIYLLLDGKRNQTEILEALAAAGVDTSPMSVSRAIVKMQTEYGIAELVRGGSTKVFRKAGEAETVLNLSNNVRDWLEAGGLVVPVRATRRRSKAT